jgi:hypothetical protein
LYDERGACEICGANRQQISSLILKKSSIPKKDIAKTIAGEVIVSEKFVETSKKWKLKGASFAPVYYNKQVSKCYQLKASSELGLSHNTVAGIDPFNFSEGSEVTKFTIAGDYKIKFEKEVYKCPKGHTIGLNLLSEAYVLESPPINNYDFFSTKQKIGVKRGVLRPEPLYLCSQAFRRMVEEEKLIGFDFEIARIENSADDKV